MASLIFFKAARCRPPLCQVVIVSGRSAAPRQGGREAAGLFSQHLLILINHIWLSHRNIRLLIQLHHRLDDRKHPAVGRKGAQRRNGPRCRHVLSLWSVVRIPSATCLGSRPTAQTYFQPFGDSPSRVSSSPFLPPPVVAYSVSSIELRSGLSRRLYNGISSSERPLGQAPGRPLSAIRERNQAKNITKKPPGGMPIPSPAARRTDEARVRNTWLGPMNGPLAGSPASPSPTIFARVGNLTQGQRVQSAGDEGAFWLELAAIALAMAMGFRVLALEMDL
jgi:hypothetical protein